MTAANHVRDEVEEADRDGRPLELTDSDIEALQRVDPEQAADTATRLNWQHRRPERVPRQPDLDIPGHQH